MILGVCKFCKKEFRKRERTRKFCSLICANRFNLNNLNKVKLPEKSKEFAEFVGICLGDGCAFGYQVAITLNSIADSLYVPYVTKLSGRLFPGATISLIKRKENAFDIRINSRQVVEFLKANGVVSNSKFIPNWIITNPFYVRSCLRGLFDTEGSISFKLYQSNTGLSLYKQLNFRNANTILIRFVRDNLIKLGFKPTNTLKRSLYLSNHQSISLFRQLIGFSNPKLLERSLIETAEQYKIWKSEI
ncbi:hypothetical protein HY025_03340 [Candidatus Daviesbacteria bacterium]|nr:hypothetical protein [Candidatus Daviesbacteria bacterium]